METLAVRLKLIDQSIIGKVPYFPMESFFDELPLEVFVRTDHSDQR